MAMVESIETSNADPPPWLLAIDKWPVRRRDDLADLVNRPQSGKEVDALVACIKRGRPYGSDAWVSRTVKALGLESTIRPRGRQQIRDKRKIKDSRPNPRPLLNFPRPL